MPDVTILVPADQATAISESLRTRRDELHEELRLLLSGRLVTPDQASAEARCRAQIAEVDAIRCASADPAAPATLTGPGPELWRAVYDVFCAAAGWLSDACSDYWDGTTRPEEIRARISSLGSLFSTLERVGPSPGRPAPP